MQLSEQHEQDQVDGSDKRQQCIFYCIPMPSSRKSLRELCSATAGRSVPASSDSRDTMSVWPLKSVMGCDEGLRRSMKVHPISSMRGELRVKQILSGAA